MRAMGFSILHPSIEGKTSEEEIVVSKKWVDSLGTEQSTKDILRRMKEQYLSKVSKTQSSPSEQIAGLLSKLGKFSEPVEIRSRSGQKETKLTIFWSSPLNEFQIIIENFSSGVADERGFIAKVEPSGAVRSFAWFSNSADNSAIHKSDGSNQMFKNGSQEERDGIIEAVITSLTNAASQVGSGQSKP